MPTKKALGRRRRRNGSRSRFGMRSANHSRNMAIETLEDRRLLAFGVPELNFDGQDYTFLNPPDPTGAVGQDYYIQMINDLNGATYAIYDKDDGALVQGPTELNLLAPIGSPCRIAAGGDPIVLYDHLADRWLLTEFTIPGTNPGTGGEIGSLCVYVSKSSDPTVQPLPDGWHHYQFDIPVFPDYPKYAVWEDGYYVTANEVSALGPNSAGVYALDRENMLQGLPARPFQRFTAPPQPGWGFQTLTPVDLDGPAAPEDSPAYFVRQRDDEIHDDPLNNPFVDFIEVFELDVNWDDAGLSSFTGSFVPVPEFDSTLCGTAFGPCFAQPGTDVELDPLKEFVMFRAQYRNFGDYETLVGNFVTDVFDNDQGGIRWFELRKTELTDWSLFQDGTIAPDFNNRWSGSIAMDGSGNIAIGYNIVSAGTLPGIRYAGREADDPLGFMRPENLLVNGFSSNTSNRWGDYSHMSVDPVDDCTFWFTGEYMQGDGNWGTRIGSFRFEACGTPPIDPPPEPGDGFITGLKWNDLDADGLIDPDEPGVPGVYIYLDLDGDNSIDLGEPAAVTDENGFYSFEIEAGDYTVREVYEPGWMQTFPEGGEWEVTVVADETLVDIDFGNTEVNDLGDAPAPYPTLIADDGASHGMLAGFGLGELVDGELDGLPDADGLGDDLDNLADEDGVVFPWALFAGFEGSVDVTASAGVSPGVLNAWLDFNMDGDWDDAGEQIAEDVVLDDGTHTLTFDVPSDAVVGNTFARFRYGYTRGIGPTGADWAGEVEDHQVLVLEDQPNARDDFYEIVQDADPTELPVLENDFPSTTDTLTIVEVTQPTRATVTIAPDGQSLFITPARGAFSPPNEQFTYTIDDGTGKQDTANVTVYIIPDIVAPIAIDDTFQEDETVQSLDVMANDLPGIAGVIELVSFTDPANGTVARDDNATPGDLTDDKIIYTPGAGFEGFDQFEYTIGNVEGQSTASVTILGDNPNAIVDLDLTLADLAGSPLQGPITVGDEFLLIATSEDLRPFQIAPGAFAVYLDILYDRGLALPNLDPNNDLGFEIEFAPFDPLDLPQGGYFNGTSGEITVPSLVDEVGAFWAGIPDNPDRPLEVFRITFTATGAGTATFEGNPADDLPGNEVLLFEPPEAVPASQVIYGFDSVEIQEDGLGGGGGEGEPLDVNDDGHISAIDALLVINNLNVFGSRPLGEGEAGGDFPTHRLDVNRDSVISAIDALLVINHLNADLGLGEGEGEAGALREARPDFAVNADRVLTDQNSESILEEGRLSSGASPSDAATDWRLNVGEEGQTDSALVVDEVDDDRWEALLENLAEDALDALLDPEDR
jgi:hypothetical protein